MSVSRFMVMGIRYLWIGSFCQFKWINFLSDELPFFWRKAADFVLEREQFASVVFTLLQPA
jgi:hypothetical protein